MGGRILVDRFSSGEVPVSGELRKGSSINDVVVGGRGQNCQWIVLKNCRHGGGGGASNFPEKLPTSFMDGP